MLTRIPITCALLLSLLGSTLTAFPTPGLSESYHHQTVAIDLSSERLSDPFTLRIVGLLPKKEYEIEMTSSLLGRRIWKSNGQFFSNDEGIIDLTGDRSWDAQRLLWLMVPTENTVSQEQAPSDTHTWLERGSIRFEIQIRHDGNQISKRVSDLVFRHRNVEVIRAFYDTYPMVIYRPKCAERLPSAMILQNGESNQNHIFASLMASRGMSVAIFTYSPSYMDLRAIPLERIQSAARWLREQPGILDVPPMLFGVSRSAELALLVASHFDEFGPVIAYHPSSVANGPLGVNLQADDAAWTFGASPIPFLAQNNRSRDHEAMARQTPPYRLESRFRLRLSNHEAYLRARIPVERIRGEIFLVSGEEDRIWPSALMAAQIEEKRISVGLGWATHSFTFPDAGHAISAPNLPLGNTTFRVRADGPLFDFGGDLLATSAASFAAWQEVSKFIDKWKHQIQQNSSQTTVEDACRAE